MSHLQINLDGLKSHLDYLQEEKRRIELLQNHLEIYMYYIQGLNYNFWYFIGNQLHALKDIEKIIDGRISFLEELIYAHYTLTDHISQKLEDMDIILEVIEGES